MAVYVLTSLFSGGVYSSRVIFLTGAVVAVVLWLCAWLRGRKSTWEREWRGRRVIVVGPPTPQVLALLDQLTTINCQTVYLAPALPDKLLFLLQAIRLRSSLIENPKAYAAPAPEDDSEEQRKAGSKPDLSPAQVGWASTDLLSAEVLDPRKKHDILRFVRLWASSLSAGTKDGMHVDAVVWAHGVGNVLDRDLVATSPKDVDASCAPLDAAENEKARFLFFTLFLPQILHSIKTSARSIRLLSLLHPIYPAGFSTSPLLFPNATPPASYALRLSHHAIRTIVFTSHFQRILDALAAKGDGSTGPAMVPEGVDVGTTKTDPVDESEDAALPPLLKPTIAVAAPKIRSPILTACVAPGWHSSSVIAPFVDAQNSVLLSLGWVLLTPLRMLVAPSSLNTVQSVFFALSAPPSIVGWGGVVKDCRAVGVPAALVDDEALGRKVWEEMESAILVDNPEKGGEASETSASNAHV